MVIGHPGSARAFDPSAKERHSRDTPYGFWPPGAIYLRFFRNPGKTEIILLLYLKPKEISLHRKNKQRTKESEKSDLRFFIFHCRFTGHDYIPAMYIHDEAEQAPHCLECGEPIYGRTDKKFCDCNCRNRWHSRLRADKDTHLRNTLGILTRNYSILENIFEMNAGTCPADVLERLGFRPEYMTHSPIKKGKHLEYRCFDFVYNMSPNKLFNLRRV